MEISNNIIKCNNIVLSSGIKQKNLFWEKQGMPTQTYAAYPSGELLKATYVTARPSKEDIANREFIKNTSFAENLEDYEVKALSGMLKSSNKNSKVLRDLIGLVEDGSVNKRAIYYSGKRRTKCFLITELCTELAVFRWKFGKVSVCVQWIF